MKLLMSAYACAPNSGSDHGIAWNWVTEAQRLGHEIWVLVSPAHRDSIRDACRYNSDVDAIHWVFPEVHAWPLKQAVEPRWERTYNLLWQRVALRHARTLHRQERFDAIHHVTWAGVRAPTFLGTLGPPLIIGPSGGGETSPLSLRDGLSLRGKLAEEIRDFSNRTITMNPLVRPGFTKAAAIFVSTTDTQNLFHGALRDKTIVFFGPNLQDLPGALPHRTLHKPLRFLYVGRLLYWKGINIALRAFAQIVKEFPDARFTIRGEGSERSRLEGDIAQYHLQNQVDFIPRLSRQEVFELYNSHDLFMFTSLHDSGGFAALEALAHGMPVVCLDLGGPKNLVTPNSGLIIKTGGRNTAQVSGAVAEEVLQLLKSPERFSTLSAGAISRARDFMSAQRVKEFYERAEPFIKRGHSARRPKASVSFALPDA
jgi:glycosyltransferase involved in cell wall biosynthesis